MWIADYNLTIEEKDRYHNLLLRNASFYWDNVKLQSILDNNQECIKEYDTYYDGTKKEVHIPLDVILRRILNKIRGK